MGNLLFGERQEHDNIVNSVQELGANCLFQHLQYIFTCIVNGRLAIGIVKILKSLLYILTTEIRSHDDNRILKVYRPTFVISKPSVVKNLKKYIENIGVSFLNLIK